MRLVGEVLRSDALEEQVEIFQLVRVFLLLQGGEQKLPGCFEHGFLYIDGRVLPNGERYRVRRPRVEFDEPSVLGYRKFSEEQMSFYPVDEHMVDPRVEGRQAIEEQIVGQGPAEPCLFERDPQVHSFRYADEYRHDEVGTFPALTLDGFEHNDVRRRCGRGYEGEHVDGNHGSPCSTSF